MPNTTHRSKASFLLGIDLGQSTDPTALVGLEVTPKDTGKRKKQEVLVSTVSGSGSRGYVTEEHAVLENSYAARYLERLLGVSYPEQVRHVARLYKRLEQEGYEVAPVVDATGVGKAIVDGLVEAGLPIIAIHIHGGNTVTREGRTRNVPKKDLAGVVQVLLQFERLKIDGNLPEASILTTELQGFKYEINQRGHVTFGNDVGSALWREAPNDDMVLATAVAAWYGENRPKPSPPIPQSRVIRTAR